MTTKKDIDKTEKDKRKKGKDKPSQVIVSETIMLNLLFLSSFISTGNFQSNFQKLQDLLFYFMLFIGLLLYS
jgi:hypothetical protein